VSESEKGKKGLDNALYAIQKFFQNSFKIERKSKAEGRASGKILFGTSLENALK
jgi:hypothetical protein